MARPPRVAYRTGRHSLSLASPNRPARERPRTPRCAGHRASADDLAQVADQQQVLEVGGYRGEVLQRLDRLLAPLWVAAAQGRREYLREQLDIAIGGGAKDAQVAPADAVARELGHRGAD